MIWRLLTTLALVLTCPMALWAQPRPGAFTTVVTTNTGVNSLNVGCAVNSTTCTGGIDAGAIALSSTGAGSIDTEGGITAGSGNVGIVDTSGRVPAISSTYFASLSGANLTGIPETAITDGSILARVAGNESITGSWEFSNPIRGAAGSASAPTFSFATDTNTGMFLFGTDILGIATGGVTHAGWLANGNLNHNKGIELPGSATGATLAASGCGGTPTNNYNPTGLATAFFIPVAAHASDSCLGGLVAQPAGNLRVLCNTPSTGGNLTLGPENGNSTAANRFLNAAVLAPDECAWVWYSTSVSRWHVIAAM